MLTAMGDLRRGVARLGAVALLVLLRADVSALQLQAQAGPTVSRRAGDPGYGPSDTLVHLYKSELSGLEHPLRAVVYDSVAFSKIWRDIMSNRPINPPPPPAVDFGRNMVIVAAMGFFPSTGASIEIRSVRSLESTLEIRVRLQWSVDCIEGAMVIYPVDVIQLPLNHRIATFVDEVAPFRCRP